MNLLEDNNTFKTQESLSGIENRVFLEGTQRNNLVFINKTENLKTLAGDTEESIIVEHNLGYIPAFLTYYRQSGADFWFTLPYYTVLPGFFQFGLSARADEDNLTITMTISGAGTEPAQDLDIKYIIFRESVQ